MTDRSKMITRTLRLLPVVVLWAVACALPAQASSIPDRARQWQRTLTAEAQYQFGLDAPISALAGQIHQESTWRADARSPWAAGLTQFTPATAADMARWYPELRPADPLNPRWAIRAMVRYDQRLTDRVQPAATDCDTWAFALSGYNGGPGWIGRDRRLCERAAGCDPARWWDHVEHHSGRSTRAMRENRDYPRRILHRWQPEYHRAGWGGAYLCEARL